MKRIIIYAIEIILFYVLQSSLFHYIAIWDISPNLLLILVVSTAYMRGRIPGLFVGFFSGLIVDIVFGRVVGLYALLYLMIGYFMGYTNKIYSNDDYTLPPVFIGISNLIYGFFYYVFEFLLRGRLNFPYYLRRFIIPEVVYTVAVSILVYKLLHMINNKLVLSEIEEK